MYQFIHTKSLKLYQLPAELSVHVLLDHTKSTIISSVPFSLLQLPSVMMTQKGLMEL